MNIIEIARLSGVSIGTVDRVVHKRGRVARSTQERVQRIIDETGYSPNALARQLKLKKPHKVGVLMPGVETESGYWEKAVKGMQRAIDEELKGFAFSIEMHSFGRRDRDSLYAAWEKMKESNTCAYIIAPVMQEEIMCMLKNDDAKKPYCFIDTQVPGLNPLCEICQDAYQAGLMTGKLTYLTSKRPGKFVAISTDTEAFNLCERARGFGRWMKDNSLPSLCVYCNGEEELFDTVQDVLKGDEIAGVCVVSASTHIAASAVADMGLKGKVSVVGFDLVDSNKEALAAGKIDCLISQRPEEQGYLAMMQLHHNVVLGDSVRERLNIPIDVYFKENLASSG